MLCEPITLMQRRIDRVPAGLSAPSLAVAMFQESPSSDKAGEVGAEIKAASPNRK
jgi:hypothetical protein